MFASLSSFPLRSSRLVATTLIRRNYGNGPKAYPQYNVFGQQCMLSLKFLPPTFKYLRTTNTLVVDSTKRGRLLIEWVPRNPDGTISREKNAGIRFGLSAEEIGLILNQLPQQNPVEFSRRPAPNEGFFDGPSAPHKVCKIVPDPTVATVNFIIDFEKDGVGGQEVQGITGPMEVTAQAGEMQVIMEIMRSTLPVLVGWTTTQDLAMQKSVGFAISAGSSGGSAPEESGYQA